MNEIEEDTQKTPLFGHQPSPHICHNHCVIQTKAKSSRFWVASGELQHLWNYEESRDIFNLEKLSLFKTYNSYSKNFPSIALQKRKNWFLLRSLFCIQSSVIGSSRTIFGLTRSTFESFPGILVRDKGLVHQYLTHLIAAKDGWRFRKHHHKCSPFSCSPFSCFPFSCSPDIRAKGVHQPTEIAMTVPVEKISSLLCFGLRHHSHDLRTSHHKRISPMKDERCHSLLRVK